MTEKEVILKVVKEAIDNALAGKPVSEVLEECNKRITPIFDDFDDAEYCCCEADIITAAESF